MSDIQIQPTLLYDVTTVGDAYVELRSFDTTLLDAKTFERHIMGSAAHIAIYMAMLGKKSAVVASVGADSMGTFIQNTLRNYKVEVSGLQYSRENPTSLIFSARSGRMLQTTYYRLADFHLHNTKDHVTLAQSSSIVHGSGFSLWKHPSRHSIFEILRLAKKFDRLTVLQPFYEPALWRKTEEALEVIKKTIQFADLVTPTIDDAENLFGKSSREDYVRQYHDLGVGKVILTMGKDGCFVSHEGNITRVPACEARIVDPSGVNDAWHAGLYYALREGKDLASAAYFGNAVGAYALMQHGTLIQLPPASEIAEKMLKKKLEDI